MDVPGFVRLCYTRSRKVGTEKVFSFMNWMGVPDFRPYSPTSYGSNFDTLSWVNLHLLAEFEDSRATDV